jgi:hypothetical protein
MSWVKAEGAGETVGEKLQLMEEAFSSRFGSAVIRPSL